MCAGASCTARTGGAERRREEMKMKLKREMEMEMERYGDVTEQTRAFLTAAALPGPYRTVPNSLETPSVLAAARGDGRGQVTRPGAVTPALRPAVPRIIPLSVAPLLLRPPVLLLDDAGSSVPLRIPPALI
ncbi:hypothetical protein VTN02DRAFT_3361 [Thermoascus thermophilus]